MSTEECECECVDCKARSLANYLDVGVDEISASRYGGNEETSFDVGNETYLVLTDDEADQLCADTIKEMVWAFNADFIIQHSDLPYEALEMIQGFQESKCEGANDTILAMIDDFEEFVDDAISADGRGHFLSGYDGEENEQDNFFIYRTN